MDEPIYLLSARLLSFLAGFLLVLGIKFFLTNRKKDGPWSDPRLPFTFRGFPNEIRLLKEAVGTGLRQRFPAKSANIERDLKLAALPMDAGDVFGAQLLWSLVLGVCGIVFMLLLNMDGSYVVTAFLIAGFIGWLIPIVQIQKLAEERLNSIRRALPFSIDLITSAMVGGLDFSAAVRYYVEHSTPCPLTQEFGVTLKMLELGNNRNDALKAMADRLGIDEFRSLVNAIVQGTEMGASITDTLRINAEEMRHVRVAAAERKAQRAPSLMMIPMALFIMPSVFIIIFVPIYLRVQASGMAGMF